MRSLPKKIFDLYLFGNFHIAIGAVAVVLTTQLLFHLQLRTELLVFIFCGTFFGYNLQRLPSAFEKAHIEKKFYRHHWNTTHRYLLSILSGIALIAFAWSFFTLYRRTQIISLIPSALSFAYAFPVIPSPKGWIRLREIPGIKIFIIGLTWSISCVLVPATASLYPFEGEHLLPIITWTLIVTLFIVAITIPFDIRDLGYDTEDLKALPHLMGEKNSRAFGALLLVICSILFYLFVHARFEYWMFFTAWCVMCGFLIMKSHPKRHEYYFSFVIDGALILLYPLLLYVKFIK